MAAPLHPWGARARHHAICEFAIKSARHHLTPGHKHMTPSHPRTSAHQHTAAMDGNTHPRHNEHPGISALSTVSLHNGPSLNTSAIRPSPYPHLCAHQSAHPALDHLPFAKSCKNNHSSKKNLPFYKKFSSLVSIT